MPFQSSTVLPLLVVALMYTYLLQGAAAVRPLPPLNCAVIRCSTIADEPVCGPDGKQYPNQCIAECSYGVRKTRPCKKTPPKCTDVMCPAIYAPVCGADGKTYPNACTAGCSGAQVISTGECKPKPIIKDPASCICITLYKPVCGTNGVTYGNSCEAACAKVAVAYDGACGGGSTTGVKVPVGLLPVDPTVPLA